MDSYEEICQQPHRARRGIVIYVTETSRAESEDNVFGHHAACALRTLRLLVERCVRGDIFGQRRSFNNDGARFPRVGRLSSVFIPTEYSLKIVAEPLLTPQFTLLLITTSIIGLSFSTYFLLPKFLAVELAADAATIGGLSGVSLLASVICMPFAGVQIDRHGRRLFIYLGALIFASASAGFLLIDHVGPLLWTLRLLQGFAWPLFYVALGTLATDIAPKARMGQAIGVFGAVMISTNALGPALAEWGAHKFGWHAVFGATVVAAVVAAIIARFLRDQHEPQARGATSTR